MKKWLAVGAGAAAVPLVVAIPLLVVVIAMVAGAAVSVVGGGAGSIFADKNVRSQYGFFGCEGGVSGGSGIPMTGTGKEYIRTMIGVAKTMNVPEEGQIIAAMTMMQESSLLNHANGGQNLRNYQNWPSPGGTFWLNTAKLSLKYPHDKVGNDADSVGLFQQRASVGWADDASFKASANPEEAIKRLLDPRWGAQQFFGGPGGSPNRGLLDISGWQSLPKGAAAQKVQGSAFPDAYNKWEADATAMVKANQDAPALPLVGGTTAPPPSTSTPAPSDGSTAENGVQYPMAEGTYSLSSPFGMRMHPTLHVYKMHYGQDFGAPFGTPIYSIADGVVVAVGAAEGYGNWIVVDHMLNGKKWSSLYAHMENDGMYVTKGQQVTKGQKIAGVGSTGYSTGPHLHFEVWDGGRFDGGKAIDPMPFLGGNYTSTAAAPSACNAGGVPIVGNGTAAAIIQAYSTILGTPYSWGGGDLNGPTAGILYAGIDGRGVVGFDCSSSVRYAVYHGTGGKGGGLILDRTAQAQYNQTKGSTVWSPGQPTSNLQPGDLLFWGDSTSRITHVALYIGNNRMYEEPGVGKVAWETDLRVNSRFLAATRLKLVEEANQNPAPSTSPEAAK